MDTQTQTSTNKTSNGGSKTSTTRQVASKAHDVVEQAAKKSEPLEKKLRKKASKAGTRLESGQEALMDTVSDSVEAVESFAKTRPLATAGIAFAAGILASTLLRRS